MAHVYGGFHKWIQNNFFITNIVLSDFNNKVLALRIVWECMTLNEIFTLILTTF